MGTDDTETAVYISHELECLDMEVSYSDKVRLAFSKGLVEQSLLDMDKE